VLHLVVSFLSNPFAVEEEHPDAAGDLLVIRWWSRRRRITSGPSVTAVGSSAVRPVRITAVPGMAAMNDVQLTALRHHPGKPCT
jgi:hypothetical protein